MRSLRWAYNHIQLMSSLKGGIWTDTHRENAVNVKAESPLMHLQVKAQEGLPANPGN